MRWRIGLLALGCAAPAGALLLVKQEVPPPLPPISVSAVASSGAVPLPAPARGPWTAQVERPLFAQSRRPPPPPEAPVAAVAPAPEPPPPEAATGLVMGGDGRGIALLRLAGGEHVRAEEGDELAGWRVSRISPEGVELARGGQRRLLAPRASAAPGLERVE
jgi:general secretion pathway protein N